MRAYNCGCTMISARPKLISGDILLLSRPRYGADTSELKLGKLKLGKLKLGKPKLGNPGCLHYGAAPG
jgi:hypothetical protein